jgi:hypothetical protein
MNFDNMKIQNNLSFERSEKSRFKNDLMNLETNIEEMKLKN